MAAAAPHHHLNPIADLVSDGPSNSGTFAQLIGPASQGHGFYPGILVQDESCLACFNRDFLSSSALKFLLATSFGPLPQWLVPPLLPSPALVLTDSPSRAPPTVA